MAFPQVRAVGYDPARNSVLPWHPFVSAKRTKIDETPSSEEIGSACVEHPVIRQRTIPLRTSIVPPTKNYHLRTRSSQASAATRDLVRAHSIGRRNRNRLAKTPDSSFRSGNRQHTLR